MSRHDLTQTLPWLREGQAYLRTTLDRLPDAELYAPSGLPAWSRAHVVGHVTRNAEALSRLATWARTGVENPMYSGPEQRAAEIESAARQQPTALRADLVHTADALEEDLDRLGPTTWQAPVRTAQGREVPAAEIPWMRVREVWLHAVDLAAAATLADLPAGVVDTLLDDVTGVLPNRDGCPPLVLEPTDRDRGWQLSADADATVLRGTAPDLLGCLVGRSDGSKVDACDRAGQPCSLPGVPRWL